MEALEMDDDGALKTEIMKRIKERLQEKQDVIDPMESESERARRRSKEMNAMSDQLKTSKDEQDRLNKELNQKEVERRRQIQEVWCSHL